MTNPTYTGAIRAGCGASVNALPIERKFPELVDGSGSWIVESRTVAGRFVEFFDRRGAWDAYLSGHIVRTAAQHLARLSDA